MGTPVDEELNWRELNAMCRVSLVIRSRAR